MFQVVAVSPGSGLADLHVILAQAVMGDDAKLESRSRRIQDMAREGRYPSGSYLPTLSRAERLLYGIKTIH